jgi:hypothetical protein
LDFAVRAQENREIHKFDEDDVVLDSLMAFSFYKVSTDDEKLSAIADGALK